MEIFEQSGFIRWQSQQRPQPERSARMERPPPAMSLHEKVHHRFFRAEVF